MIHRLCVSVVVLVCSVWYIFSLVYVFFCICHTVKRKFVFCFSFIGISTIIVRVYAIEELPWGTWTTLFLCLYCVAYRVTIRGNKPAEQLDQLQKMVLFQKTPHSGSHIIDQISPIQGRVFRLLDSFSSMGLVPTPSVCVCARCWFDCSPSWSLACH